MTVEYDYAGSVRVRTACGSGRVITMSAPARYRRRVLTC